MEEEEGRGCEVGAGAALGGGGEELVGRAESHTFYICI